jgi:cyclase
MRNIRVIARLDVKGPDVINTVQLEGLRKVGSPNKLAKNYYNQGADELLIIDQVASLYQRDHLVELIKIFTKEIFIPITVGGGIKSVDDARLLLRSGADKVAINTAAVSDPNLISQLAKEFGKQCVVISIPCKMVENKKWEVYMNGGRDKTGLEVFKWARKVISLGAGELLVTSIDKDGLRNGFDLNLMREFNEIDDVPLIASGGLGKPSHISDLLSISNCEAIASADFLHMKRGNIQELKNIIFNSKFKVRL